MRRLPPVICLAAAMLVLSSVAHGQQCTPPAQPAFEFQVDVPAGAIPDSTHPHPAGNRLAGKRDDPDAIIVQFVVDTAGVPIVATFRALKVSSHSMADSIKAVLSEWRFTPAVRAGCRVPQLVQTTVVP